MKVLFLKVRERIGKALGVKRGRGSLSSFSISLMR
jgi:hypothetical protein